MASLKKWLGEVNLALYALVCVFGMSAWVALNGLWVQMPYLVQVLPEGWNLPAYFFVIIQIANVGPLLYTVLNKIFPRVVDEPPAVFLIIVVGAVSCVFLVFFWPVTSYVGDAQHSTVLLALTAVLALVDCTSSVVYLPYMAVHRPQYMTALYTGEGLGGLIPGILGVVQGTGQVSDCTTDPLVNLTSNQTSPSTPSAGFIMLFSVEIFFWMMFVILTASGIAFGLIHFLPKFKKECRFEEKDQFPTNPLKSAEKSDERSGILAHNSIHHQYGTVESDSKSREQVAISEDGVHIVNREMHGNSYRYSNCLTCPLLMFMFWLNFLSLGMMPSLQTYSTLPYGNTAYSLAVTLSMIANPVTSFTALFIRCRSMWLLIVLLLSGTVCAAYIIYLASLSPSPPLVDTTDGIFIAVLSWVMMTGIFSFTKVSIASILRYKGKKALLLCGLVTQGGTLLGTVLSFVLTTVLQIFQSKPACS